MVGGVRSTFTGPTVAVPVLPATSAAVPVTDWFAPWFTVVGPLQVARPDSASAHENDTATGERNQLFAFGVALKPPVIVGGVLSRLTTVETDELLPALSAAEPDTCCAAPSDVTVWADEHDAIPDTESVHVNVTVTLARFHPAAFGAGVSDAVIVGPVLSIRTVTVWVDSTLPATSVLAYVSVCTPSVVKVALVPSTLPPPSTAYTVLA